MSLLKIAINTIVDYSNYGNRLQNYAMQVILEQLGHDVVTLDTKINYVPDNKSKFSKILHLIISGQIMHKVLLRKYNKLRKSGFRQFSKQYIKESSFRVSKDTTDFSFDSDIDCYVVGSDQVWNYSFSRFSSRDFISYSEKPRISYAASFGVSSIPDDLKLIYTDGLKSFNSLSVRERAGVNIIEDLCQRHAELVLDPTLLISQKVWKNLISERKKYKKKYALVYFLGDISKKDRDYIKLITKESNLEVKQLGYEKDYNLWAADPIEFVNLFSQAELVFTDSFHACVFSIVFKKNFEVFKRQFDGPSMNSRIETLLSDFKLNNQWHMDTKTREIINYEEVDSILQEKRERSLNYLSTALNDIQKGLINE